MKRALALLLLLAAAALSGGVGRSQATFVAASDQAASTLATSPAFNGVAVALADPGTPLRAAVPLSATATSDRALVSVTFQRSPAGAGTWTTICAPSAAPYACSWDSTAVADGLYDLRAVALDASGYSRTSGVGSRRVDNTAPAISVMAATPLTGTAAVSATATDGGAGVISVAFEARRSSGGSWTPICSDGTAPYSCAWNTGAVADGAWEVRATATDGAGNTASSTTTNRIVDNTAPTVTISDDGVPKRGTATLYATSGDGAGTGVSSIRYQHRPSGGGAWTDACTGTTAPFSCDVSTTTVPDGLYDVRAIATDGVALATTSATITVRIDNTAPSSATMTTPATPITGTITLNGAAADAVGLSSLRFEYRTAGSGGTWTTACTDSSPPSPFSCTWNSATAADGSYEFRSVATDTAGNTTASTVTAARTVDNGGPTVSVSSPAQVRGAANTVTATATDVSGVASVAIRYRPAGSGSYTTICTDALAPYSCPWAVTALADGPYELIAVATDTIGFSTTSSVATTAVNNTGPTGTDVQSTNGNVNDKLDAGDRVIFSYSAQIAPASLLAGWTGASTAIRVRVNNNGTSDSMEFYDAANTTPLKLLASGTALAINGNHVSQGSLLNATIAQAGSTVTVTIGSLISGAVRTGATGSTPMTWRTNAAATSLSGTPVYATTVTESGVADVDF